MSQELRTPHNPPYLHSPPTSRQQLGFYSLALSEVNTSLLSAQLGQVFEHRHLSRGV